MRILIQASTTNWQGGKDPCMELYKGKTLLEYTINQFIDYQYDVHIIAPLSDKGKLNDYKFMFDKEIDITYGFNESPLNRMITASNDLNESDYVIRVDGRNFCADVAQIFANYQTAVKNDYDCVRFPENFSPLFAGDVYNVGALRRLYKKTSVCGYTKIDIHPKYFMDSIVVTPDLEKYDDAYLTDMRDIYAEALKDERICVNTKSNIVSADQISFHYHLAERYIPKDSHIILDIACGSGYGTKALSKLTDTIVGIDINKDIIQHASKEYGSEKILFSICDANNITYYPDNSIDAITAFEIVEHIPPVPFLKEMYRLLKPNGIILISTPQNIIGRIPITGAHIREFSLDEIKDIVGGIFTIDEIIGLKQGTIYNTGDEIGSNTFIVARKEV